MTSTTQFVVPDRHSAGRARQARLFLAVAALVMLTGFGIAWSLIQVLGWPDKPAELRLPRAFLASTLLLGAGSLALHRAGHWVAREKQRAFRGWLSAALLLGTLFLGVQSYGLLSLVPAARSMEEASLGVKTPVLMIAGLHAMHFFIATLFVAFVATRTVADRYDHEYHWGVTFCAWFWHALGVAWLAILTVFAIAM
ncbi:MAG: cytochrome c oxidase subunit 3 [Planctomyces sp.]|nr:cytochrome c oxidase subunit 3 [Planctomyces sp.]